MELNEYQRKACEFNDTFEDTFRGEMGLMAGWVAEVGEACAVTQKKIRDGMQYEIAQKRRMKELGDSFWYFAVYAKHLGFNLEDIANFNLRKCEDRKARDVVSGDGDDR